MILTNIIEVKIAKANVKHYKSLGYNCKCGDIISVTLDKLPTYSRAKITIQCDYCGKIITRQFHTHKKQTDNDIIHKDACIKCAGKKRKESNLLVYGVGNCMSLPEAQEKHKKTLMKNYGVEYPRQSNIIMDKINQTNMEKYGTTHPMKNDDIKLKHSSTCFERYGVGSYTQTDECKTKTKKTNLEKYGVENVFQFEEFKEKQMNTCLEKYGCENVFQNEEIKDKIKETLLEKYGVEHIMQNDQVKQKVIRKRTETLFKNGSSPISKQQEYLNNLIGGIINYPVEQFNLDIAFPEEKLYIEYNGGGHDFAVKIGRITESQLKQSDMKRYFILKKLGWNQICIFSPRDYLPSDDIILQEIKKAKIWLSLNESGHSHYNINISEFVDDINFGKLRQVN